MAVAGQESAETTPARRVVVVGRSTLQNRLMCGLIAAHLGCSCQVWEIGKLNGAALSKGAIALLDVDGMPAGEVERSVGAILERAPAGSIAFINADEKSVAQIVDAPGVQGVFFHDTSQQNLIKGIQAIFAGEYWLPRVLLSAHFAKTRPRRVALLDSAVELTRKEAETLKLLLGGGSNSAIARRLGVSPHTVKTHLYNLFRKIGAKNRVQAVNWAMQNIQGAAREPG